MREGGVSERVSPWGGGRSSSKAVLCRAPYEPASRATQMSNVSGDPAVSSRKSSSQMKALPKLTFLH